MISFRSFLPVAAAAACVPSTRHESQATQACSAAAAGETALAPGGWSEAERVDLGGEFSDLYPTLTHDGQRLAFTSYRPFPGDTSAHPRRICGTPTVEVTGGRRRCPSPPPAARATITARCGSGRETA